MATQYVYEFGRRWHAATASRDIAWLVSREHVGAPDADIVALIESRIPVGAPCYTPAIRRECAAYALAVHEANRALYRRVMKG